MILKAIVKKILYSTYGDSFEDALKMGLEWLILTLSQAMKKRKKISQGNFNSRIEEKFKR